MRLQPKAISTLKEFPRTVEAFLEELDRRFPEPRPRSDQSHADLMFVAGQRSVVLAMRDALDKSQSQ